MQWHCYHYTLHCFIQLLNPQLIAIHIEVELSANQTMICAFFSLLQKLINSNLFISARKTLDFDWSGTVIQWQGCLIFANR